MSSDKDVPSPATDPDIFQLTDEGIAQYIEFPEDTIYIESVASHERFKQGVAYVAAQRKGGESYVYEIAPGMSEAKKLFGPLQTKDESTKTTIFGSALTSTGILYLTCFNRNSVLVYDLTDPDLPALCKQEIPDLPSPNDVCIDPKDESILYVCGGTFRKLFFGKLTFTNSALGQVFKVKVNLEGKGTTVESVKDGLDTLAGVEVVGDDLWVAQLYDLVSLKQPEGYALTEQWKGNDGNGTVWLADNIDVFYSTTEGDLVLVPAYSLASELSVKHVLERNWAMSILLFVYQIQTLLQNKEALGDALLDPEVSLALSNTYIEEGVDPRPIRIVCMSPTDSNKVYHFEIDLKETREKNKPWEPSPDTKPGKMRHFFNEQVTHSSHLRTGSGEGYVVCVNFEQPRILLLKDDKFQDCIAGK